MQTIEHEANRQVDVLESGGRIVRETRLYDHERDETRSMRTKEESDDYRYFPDPDLLPVHIDQALLEAVREELPELPAARRHRYVETLGLSAYDAGWLTQEPETAAYFEAVVAAGGDAKLSANWVMGELSAALNRDERAITDAPVTPDQLAQPAERVSSVPNIACAHATKPTLRSRRLSIGSVAT